MRGEQGFPELTGRHHHGQQRRIERAAKEMAMTKPTSEITK
jgi:hypothetical protein